MVYFKRLLNLKSAGFMPAVVLVLFSAVILALIAGYAMVKKGTLPQSLKGFEAVTRVVDSTGAGLENLKQKTAGTVDSSVDLTKLPLGDGKYSTEPKNGYVYSCMTVFNGGGAEHAGDWIQGNTWDLTKKIFVEGSVSWPNARFSDYVSGMERVLSGNGLPVDSNTGTFPIQKTDPAFQYDRNPNSIEAQNVNYQLSSDPQIAAISSCVPMGAVGYALNGVAVYNALDAAGRDAVAHEVQDNCSGHPQGAGEYHYHGPSDCMPHANENNALVGYSLDGFGIYSKYDASGREYTNEDLDECHGTVSEVEWNGKMVRMYHYVLTQEYPYTIGCFKGTPVKTNLPGAGSNQGGPGLGGNGQNGLPPGGSVPGQKPPPK